MLVIFGAGAFGISVVNIRTWLLIDRCPWRHSCCQSA